MFHSAGNWDSRRYTSDVVPMGLTAIRPETNEGTRGRRDFIVQDFGGGLSRAIVTHPVTNPMSYHLLN